MPNASARAASLVLALSSVLVLGCGSPTTEKQERLGHASERIKGGMTDKDDTNVVVIYDATLHGLCSGSLIAPNLVLTAHHCVASIVDGDHGIDCQKTGFAPQDPYVAKNGGPGYLVSTNISFYSTKTFHNVRDVLVPTTDPHICNQDQAAIILSDNIGEGESIPPFVPRVDVELKTGEGYHAIGYGDTGDPGTGAGTRRRLDGLKIRCAGGKCDSYGAGSKEFAGDHGICHGDSGGPAVDEQGRVIGVTSRGLPGCNGPIYGDVYGWGDWLKIIGQFAAKVGGYPPPPWSTGFPTDPIYSAPLGDPCQSPDQCEGGACEDGYCTRPCSDAAYCNDGYSCESRSGNNVCIKIPGYVPPAAPDDPWNFPECNVAPAVGSSGSGVWLLGVLGLGLLARRRRRA